MAGRLADRICRWVLGPASVNAEKNEEEGGWDRLKICWGLLYNTLRMTVTLPEAKLLKAHHLLHDPRFDPGNRVLPLLLPQQLRGNAEYWVVVCPSFAPELAIMNRMLSAPEGVREHTVDTQHEQTWRDWEEMIELCRVFVARPELWESQFTSGIAGVLPPLERLEHRTGAEPVSPGSRRTCHLDRGRCHTR